MKKSLLSFLLLFVCTAVFAGGPIKGVSVKCGKNPGGDIASKTTDNSGNFSFDLGAGDYELAIPYNQLESAYPQTNGNIILTLSCTDTQSGIPTTVTIVKSTLPVKFRVTTRTATMRGTLTYVVQVAKVNKLKN